MGLRRLPILLPALLCHLVVCIGNADAWIRSVSLENATAITDLPVVGKCCAVGEILTRNSTDGSICTAKGTSINFSPIFHEFNVSGYVADGETRDDFVAVTGNPCKFKRFLLNPSESFDDNNYLLMNGSVYWPHSPKARMLQPRTDYCMELVSENTGLVLRTVVCYPEERVIMIADSRITIYACGLLISVPFLILTIVAYSITPKLRDVYGRTLCRYCGCLTVAFTMLAIAHLWNGHLSDQACFNIAYVVQFSFAACFFWLNAMCIEKWFLVRSYIERQTYKRMNEGTLFFWYSLWCWGPSVVLILVSMVTDLSPTVTAIYLKSSHEKGRCSFKTDDSAVLYFYVPSGLLLLGNAILMALIFVKLNRYQRALDLRRLARNQESDWLDRRHLRRLTNNTYVCMIVSILVTLNWMMELIAWYVNGDSTIDWSPFQLVNALQGVWIMGLFVLRRPPRDLIWRRIQRIRGVDVEPEPELGSMELFLVPVTNGDTMLDQRVIQ